MAEQDDAAKQDKRRLAGDYLKQADKLFKSGDFEGAQRLVLLAMETDSRNPYAIAYQERVRYAIEKRDTTKAAPASESAAIPPIEAKPTPTDADLRTRNEAAARDEEKRRLEELEVEFAPVELVVGVEELLEGLRRPLDVGRRDRAKFIDKAIRSAKVAAPSRAVSGMATTNSSPP